MIKDIYKHNDNNEDDYYFELYCKNTQETLYNIPLHIIYTLFQPYFASTIAGIQGARIEQIYSIWEMVLKSFSRNALNSATGRAINRTLPHFSNTDTTNIYEWEDYKTHMLVDSKPDHNAQGYDETHFSFNHVKRQSDIQRSHDSGCKRKFESALE